MESLKLSIVIPTYNRKNELRKLLDALDSEDYPFHNFEVIVVDDGSCDGTVEFMESYASHFNLVTVFHKKNMGSAASRNDGVRTATNEIILFLDDDLVPSTGIIRNHIRHHNKNNCAVIGNIQYRETFNTRWVSRYLSTRGVHKIKLGERIPFKCLWTSNTSIRKEHLLEVGLFDEQFKGAGGEDTEIAYRLEKAGIQFVFANNALSYHKPVSLPQLLKKQELFAKNALPLLVEKNEVFKKIFRVDLMKNPFVRFALSPVVYFPLYWLARIMNLFYLPPFIIDYLLLQKRYSAK